MSSIPLVELELARHDWSSLVCADGLAENIPQAVRGLLQAASWEERQRYYWQLDNHVVTQGNLFEAAVPLVGVLCAALTQELPRPARSGVLEILFQIVAGEPSRYEIERGLTDLDMRARQAAIPAIWLLYEELATGHYDLANMILEEVDPDRERYEYFLAEAVKAGRKL